MARAELLMPFILKWEGGFSDHPADRGGATYRGVTLATFRQFYGTDRTAADLRAMTEEQWLRIFREGYWNRWQADRIASQSLADIRYHAAAEDTGGRYGRHCGRKDVGRAEHART